MGRDIMPNGKDERTKGMHIPSYHEVNLGSEELQLTPNSVKVLERRYLKKNEQSKVTEGPVDLFKRVSMNIAEADLKYQNIRWTRTGDVKCRQRAKFKVRQHGRLS